MAYGRSDGSLELHIEDSTGVVHVAEFNITGLEAAEVGGTSGGKTQMMIASDGLTIALPMEEASVVRIEG